MPFFARFLLGKVLGNPEVKKRVMEELAKAAQRTDTKLDDDAVRVVGEVWDVVVPVIVGKL